MAAGISLRFPSARRGADTDRPEVLVSDTSRQGRYLNRRYATLAGELGLDVAHLNPIGWSATSVPEPAAARYTEALAEPAAALMLWRRAEHANPAGLGSVPQRPGLHLWLRPADPGGPLGTGAGPSPVRWLRSRSSQSMTRNVDAYQRVAQALSWAS